MPPRPDQRNRVTLAVVLGVVLLAALGVVFIAVIVFAASSLAPFVGRVFLEDLTVGQCFNGARASGTSTQVLFAVEIVDCSEPHTSELVATFDYPSTAEDYPGQGPISSYADEKCSEQFAEYVGISYEFSQLEMTTVFPLAFNWLAGDRSIQCIVHPPRGQETSTGSYRNSGR